MLPLEQLELCHFDKCHYTTLQKEVPSVGRMSCEQPCLGVGTSNQLYGNSTDTYQLMENVSSGISMCRSKNLVFQLSDVEQLNLVVKENQQVFPTNCLRLLSLFQNELEDQRPKWQLYSRQA